MSELKIFHEGNSSRPDFASSNPQEIKDKLRSVGIRFEQFVPDQPVGAGDSQEQILAAYRAAVDRLVAEEGFQAVDVISLKADHPDKAAIRQKFLKEHTHSEDEVRLFVDGCGLFYLHLGDKVCSLLCEKGDLVSVPMDTPGARVPSALMATGPLIWPVPPRTPP